jgi:RNA polymerase sigma-70 factor, ECF subfamily
VTEPSSAEQAAAVERAPSDTLSNEFRGLFEAEFGYVCRSLRRLGVEVADLPDVAQELFLAVHRQLPIYDRARPVRPWLLSFSLRFAANYRRLARKRVFHVDTDTADHSVPNVEERDLVLRALARLDFDRRVVLVMHDLEGLDVPEIANQTGVPLNTAYSRLRLARADFRDAVSRLQKDRGRT